MLKFLFFLYRLLSLLFWILLMLGFNNGKTVLITLIAAALHEVGHALMIFLVDGRFPALPRARLFGLTIGARRLRSYRGDAAVALAGPAINIAIFLLCLLIGARGDFGVINFITAISNLLPLRGYDGYNALLAVLSQKMGSAPAHRLISGIAFALNCALVFLALYFLYRMGEGYWIFSVFFSSMLCEIAKSLRRNEKRDFGRINEKK
jgi:Zn-dependent protease